MTIDDLALTFHPDLGCKTAIHLLECFGSVEAIYAATEEELINRAKLKPALAQSLVRRECHQKAEQELNFCTRNSIQPIAVGDAEYPGHLMECPDYPHVLYVKGKIDFNSGHWLSMVGTRKATPYGDKVCDRLIGELAAQFPDLVVVSGLAYGIDVAAHRAALRHGVRTVAVLGHPLTHIYPRVHIETARQIVKSGGALVSEYPSTAHPDRAGFIQRNRLIAGLSDGTVIVESAARGGSLITADMASGYNREVMAVPGRIGDRNAEGTNRLIRSLKAQIVCCGADIAESLGWETEEVQEPVRPIERVAEPETDSSWRNTAAPIHSQEVDISVVTVEPSQPDRSSGKVSSTEPGEARVSAVPAVSEAALKLWQQMGEDPVELDELSRRSGVSVTQLPVLLLELELAGSIRMLPGNQCLKL